MGVEENEKITGIYYWFYCIMHITVTLFQMGKKYLLAYHIKTLHIFL